MIKLCFSRTGCSTVFCPAVVPLQPGAVPQLPSSTTSSGSTAGATARGTAGQILATGMGFGTSAVAASFYRWDGLALAAKCPAVVPAGHR